MMRLPGIEEGLMAIMIRFLMMRLPGRAGEPPWLLGRCMWLLWLLGRGGLAPPGEVVGSPGSWGGGGLP